uniref:HDC12658 n=1 Tax=Drosophila melanogaster TaxID=7227 RepID=Q6IKE6_DROME|nr:uncharacterized protein Dmel_CG44261 [Drosophila melanogaster]AHN57250.1 uncharacterized protein Dmel_CG44261 [Drosophila melanogaster]DAA03926.1 TPA_inf: HDC12658 [Drosophila melanogaster]|eukprot:NP_001287251.1 uncharacterized protein Dmel_CG44261 [Drosophila melanogaster]
MYFPTTPVTSRSGYLRGRKRINPHPISQLQSGKPTSEDDQDSTNVDLEESISSSYSSETDISMNVEAQDTSTDSGLDTSQESSNEPRYSLRKMDKNPL